MRPNLHPLRPPHLRPWRDGWRHLRYLLMLSPTWVFGVPALAALGLGTTILLFALLGLAGVADNGVFGASWSIVAGTLVIVGHMSGIIAVAAHLYGVKAGYRQPRPVLRRFRSLLTLEFMLISGGALLLASGIGFAAIAAYWSAASFAALPSILPVVLCCCAGAVGMQNILGGFMLAIVGGHEAAFLTAMPQTDYVYDAGPAAAPARS